MLTSCNLDLMKLDPGTERRHESRGGRISIRSWRKTNALNWDGTPALILETLEISHMQFCDVDEFFALVEGENDNLEGWRRDHRKYFERNGGFDNEMTAVCERFKLVHDFRSQEA